MPGGTGARRANRAPPVDIEEAPPIPGGNVVDRLRVEDVRVVHRMCPAGTRLTSQLGGQDCGGEIAGNPVGLFNCAARARTGLRPCPAATMRSVQGAARGLRLQRLLRWPIRKSKCLLADLIGNLDATVRNTPQISPTEDAATPCGVTNSKGIDMKLAQITAALAFAALAASAFGATSDAEKATGQTSATTNAYQWIQAGDRALQSEQERAALDRQGFPQYAE